MGFVEPPVSSLLDDAGVCYSHPHDTAFDRHVQLYSRYPRLLSSTLALSKLFTRFDSEEEFRAMLRVLRFQTHMDALAFFAF